MDNYMLILSGTEDLMEELSSIFSPIQRFFFRMKLEPFDLNDTIEAIEKPLRTIKSKTQRPDIFYDFAKEVQAISGGNPYEVNLICHFAYKNSVKSGYRRLALSPEILRDIADQQRRLGDLKALYESRTQLQRELLNELATVGEPASSWDLARLELDFSNDITDETKVEERKIEYDSILNELEKDRFLTSRNVSWKKLYSYLDPMFQMFVKYVYAIPSKIKEYRPGHGLAYTSLMSCTEQIMNKMASWMTRRGINVFQYGFTSGYSTDNCSMETGVPEVEGVNDRLFGREGIERESWSCCFGKDNLDEITVEFQKVESKLRPLFDRSEYELLSFKDINEFSLKSIFAYTKKDDEQAKGIFSQVCNYLSENW
jgi:hypothetical protein